MSELRSADGASKSISAPTVRGTEAIWMMAVALLATLPFLAKPLHIDDPADLEYVEQVLRHPGDPYGFEVDWDEGPRSAFRNYHPPLKYYYHALFLWLFPYSEITLHASYIPFVMLTAWAVIRLAHRFDCPPILLLVLWMLGPGYLPGQNAMLDVPTMALGLAGTALFIEGVDRNRWAGLLMGSVLLGSALLTKYSAIIYLPVWVGYLLAFGRGRHWLILGVPALMFAAWCGVSALLYGEMHPQVLFTRVPGHPRTLIAPQRFWSAVIFLGGAMPTALALQPMRGRGGGIALLAALGLVSALVWAAPPARRVLNESTELTAVNLCLWCVLAASGAGVVLFAVLRGTTSAWSRASSSPGWRDEAFLSYWFVGTLVIGVLTSPFMAMRRVVEACLPAWMLLTRRIPSGRWGRVVAWSAAVVNSLLGFTVAAADYEFARVYATFARNLAEISGPGSGRVWCHGYWGWYHYTRLQELRQYVIGRDEPPPKSLLVIPGAVAKPAVMPESLRRRARWVGRQDVPGYIPIRLMSYQAGAGYYSTSWGPLPYAWSMLPWDVFNFFEVTEQE